ncbi:MAG: hypothetical protein EPN47_01625 [Acidobacteria bacterium]|nr:MAG: hypothetical protein EPN47_01625 [Acidobacteriota bacterium]
MRKPWWVRAIGAIGWVCAFLAFACGYAATRFAVGNMIGEGLFIFGFAAVAAWMLWGVMSFVLYAMRRAGRQNAAIVRDVLDTNFRQARSASGLGPRESGTLDHVSLNSPPRQAAPARQTGSVFGLTLGQQPRAGHPARAVTSGASPHPEIASGFTDVPFMAPGPSGAPVPPGHGAGSRGEEAGAKGGRSIYTYEAPGLPLCPKCGVRPVIFYCTSHSQALCLECVVRHDRAGECTYVPGWRGKKPVAL